MYVNFVEQMKLLVWVEANILFGVSSQILEMSVRNFSKFWTFATPKDQQTS